MIPVETYFPEVGLPMGLHLSKSCARCVFACVCLSAVIFTSAVSVHCNKSAGRPLRRAPEERNHEGTWNVSSLRLDALGGVMRTQKEKRKSRWWCVGGGGKAEKRGEMHVCTLQLLPEVPAV